jgi:L-ascorbate metabolism protein UlaG (beta-lactamase superfamily)
LDYETVTELEPRVKKVVTALGVGSHLEYWHYPVEKIVELDWWQASDLGNGNRITATPARHFSGRDLHKNKTFWASFVYETPKRTIWIGGDGGYGKHYSTIKANFPNIDLGILENGQYNPDWAQVHTMPQYLSKEMTELGAKRYLTVHHSKFCLSKHPYFEPLENAKKAAKESGKPLLMPIIGEVVYLE